MSDEQHDALVEAAVTPYRDGDAEGRLVPPPAWWDLSPAARDDLYRLQLAARAMERALDEQGQSGTIKAVLRRI